MGSVIHIDPETTGWWPATAPFPSDHSTRLDFANNTLRRVDLPKPDRNARPSECQDIDAIDAYAATGNAVPSNPHTFLTNIAIRAAAPSAIAAQLQIATFFASNGTAVIDPDGGARSSRCRSCRRCRRG